MPYEWSSAEPERRTLTLWPNRSLTAPGFVWFIGLTAALLSLPLIGVIGSPVLWGLLPFLLAAIWGIWWALNRNQKDGALREVLTLTREELTLVRTDPKGATKEWTANPYWVSVGWHESGGPVEKYLTLKGSGREVEIGAFLSPDERVELRRELERELARCR